MKKDSKHKRKSPPPFTEEHRRRIGDASKERKHKKGFNADSNNPRWKGGKPKCGVCKIQLSSYNSKFCLKHSRSGPLGKTWKVKDTSKMKRFGVDNPAWKGGITKENHKIRTSIESELWRSSVFARDNWTCQKYGIKGGRLHAHHINNFADFPELRLAIDNGVTLSEKAHREFHKKYGIKNNTPEQLQEFLSKVTW